MWKRLLLHDYKEIYALQIQSFRHCSTAIRIMIIARARKNRADDTKARNQRQIITLYLLTESILAHCRYVTTENLVN